MMQHFKIVFTDLDGTLLTDDKQISKEDRISLDRLGEYGVLRVAATGRNLDKVRDVVPESIPLDYVIFSSGAGVFDWRNNKLIDKRNLNEAQTRELKEFFVENDISFFVFEAVPDNQWMFYFSG
ncbi:MAG: HAD hydrolase family protein, partial [Bacteroidota bacterium]|nr:HAD hydrolase family protein [Bacteroidota bacterium]